MTRAERKKVGRIQHLVGLADALYHNDRDMMTADKIEPVLKEAFDICVELLGKYPPEDMR